MIKPSIVVTVKDGQPTVELITLDADEAIKAYKESKDEVILFLKPSPEKRKRAEKPVAVPVKKVAKKASKKAL